MKLRILQTLTFAFLIFLQLPLLLTAQDKDPLEMARDYPPTLIEVDVALQQMQWRLKQLNESNSKQSIRVVQSGNVISNLKDQIKKHTQQLPIELRYANDDVRSKLIGDVLRELLAGRLEVASQEEAIAQFTLALEESKVDQSKVEELRKRKHQIDIEASQQNLSAARMIYERAVKLEETSAISQQELAQSRFALKIAEMEVQRAELNYELEQSSRENEIANRIVEARISLQPAKARVEAAEKFLKLFSESHETFDTIAELQRRIAGLNENRQEAERRAWKIEDQISELDVLLNLTKAASQALGEDAKPDAKE